MSTHRFGRALRASVAVAALSAALVPAAHAQAPPAADGPFVIGFEPKTTDAATHAVTGVMHCVPPEQAGRVATFNVADSLEIAGFTPGAAIGIEIAPASDGAKEIVRIVPAPCQFRPGGAAGGPGPVPPPGGTPPGPGQPGGPGSGPQTGPHNGVPTLERGFLNRVWKFEGEADGYEDGVLSITLSKILNVPKKMADQDDELVDQDTLVLVGSRTRVYDGNKPVRERKEASELASAENVRVQGKMLPPSKWRKDEDDQPVPTIRAKKVFILG
jgi:hypothetical protein